MLESSFSFSTSKGSPLSHLFCNQIIDINPYILDAWHIRAIDFPNDPLYKKSTELTRFEKLAWSWKKVDEKIHNALKDDSNSLTIRFEDIFSDKNGIESFKKILHFFNMSYLLEKVESDFDTKINAKINRTVKYITPNWRDWSEELKESFSKIAGDRLNAYNYTWD